MDPAGLEPAASALQGQRSSQLSYGPEALTLSYMASAKA